MAESSFQAKLRKRIEKEIPESVTTKNDPNDRQGFPDLTVSYKDRVAYLECKDYKDAPVRKNQKYWIDYFSQFTYATFVYPENVEEVMDALQQALRPER